MDLQTERVHSPTNFKSERRKSPIDGVVTGPIQSHHCDFSHSTVAILHHPELELLTDLDRFPQSDLKHDEKVFTDSGKDIPAKERHAWSMSSIVFKQEDGQHSGNKRLLCLFDRSFFLFPLLHLEVCA
ncbi:50S ribosomal protein L25 [Spatholobus suberectus]|nr:50S ribosomal protein L25 [Spatholobus suberectus]